MIFVGIKVFLAILMAPFCVALLFVYGIRNGNRKLKILFDEKMYGRVLSNFNGINFRIKTLLCVIIACVYSFLLVGDRKIGNFMLKISTSRDLTKFLIILLIVEQLISTRKHAKNHYTDRKTPHV
ncbi:MAG: hypothetical protein LBC11_03970 [Puniceicoccales bacterium]|jgi:uncharacterized membrane protein YbaN (DUF454 family)|nr:hypothetical protein [Puniceicoccales bacterium]